MEIASFSRFRNSFATNRRMESSQDGNAHYGYSRTGNVSDTDLVDGFLIRAEALYGPRFPGVTFEVQESPTAGQSEHDRAAQRAGVYPRFVARRSGCQGI
jgi:hypothetical protein